MISNVFSDDQSIIFFLQKLNEGIHFLETFQENTECSSKKARYKKIKSIIYNFAELEQK